jgi:hypothetical protein
MEGVGKKKREKRRRTYKSGRGR